MPEVDPSLGGAFAEGYEWRIYKIPGMLNFAKNFPNVRYVLAEVSHPWPLFTYLLPALDSSNTKTLGQYGTGGYEFIPRSVQSILWGGTGTLHCALLLAFLSCYRRPRRDWQATPRTYESTTSGAEHALRQTTVEDFIRTPMRLYGGFVLAATTGSLAALAARLFDTMEQSRHALPFHVLARISLWLLFAVSIPAVFQRPNNHQTGQPDEYVCAQPRNVRSADV